VNGHVSARFLPTKHKPVVWGVLQVLFGSEVLFGDLNAGVAEEELNLFQFPAPAST
jgi:hypothetical protein